MIFRYRVEFQIEADSFSDADMEKMLMFSITDEGKRVQTIEVLEAVTEDESLIYKL